MVPILRGEATMDKAIVVALLAGSFMNWNFVKDAEAEHGDCLLHRTMPDTGGLNTGHSPPFATIRPLRRTNAYVQSLKQ